MLAVLLALGVATNACEGQGTAVRVELAAHRMVLCEGGIEKDSFKVALGTGGVDKRREGDAKVPVGEYALDPPRPSKDYLLFLHVGYPTAAQRRQGLTGSAIGVHGPPRGYDYPESTQTDWTLGCIAVGTDREILRIATWVRERNVRRIILK